MDKKPRVVGIRVPEKLEHEKKEEPQQEGKEVMRPITPAELPKPKIVEEREHVDYSLVTGREEAPDLVKRKVEQASNDILPVQPQPWTPKEIDEARGLAKKLSEEQERREGFLGKLKKLFGVK